MTASPRMNRVDPFGDLHAVASRGMFTGNRGCLVDDLRQVTRHHQGPLWIVCVTEYRDWKAPLDQPRRWTPIFFLDDAVALAAGHRPCGLCRRADYLSYRDGVTTGLGLERPVSATELNQMLARERLRRGRGLSRARDRKVWNQNIETLPDGVVILDDGETPRLVVGDRLMRFEFGGWTNPLPRPSERIVRVLTPPTSVIAIVSGYRPVLHPSATLPPG